MSRRQARLTAVVGLLLASAVPLHAADYTVSPLANAITDGASINGQTYDYIIVGAGNAGSVIANRLSADPTVTVAVIEAGADGSAVSEKVLSPGQAYFGGLASETSDYDWKYQTSAQAGLNGRNIYWPRGKIVGGSSAVNGLYMTRASEIEHNSWNSLSSGNSSWSWDTIYPFMKKSETWTAPSQGNIDLANMTYLNPSFHGTQGPIHYSYPGFFYPQVSEWTQSMAALGIVEQDPAGGETWGSYVSTSAINPDGWTRSYAKTGYLDPIANRTNLHILTGFQATKIIFSGTTATGVSYAASAAGTVYTIGASKEVILSAGVINSPQLLQVSGVGPAALLNSLDIPVVVDLPGVGAHLTDHLSSAIVYAIDANRTGDSVETDPAVAAEQLALWLNGDASSLYNSPNDALAYIDLVTLFGKAEASALISNITAQQSHLVAAYSTDPTIQAGYNATYSAELKDVYDSKIGQAEILMSNTGTYGSYGNTTKTVSIQAAIQHPLSRGSVQINSTSTFDAPIIDPGYLTHPADIIILREAFKFARKLGQTAPLSTILTSELNPGAKVSTDAEWESWIRGAVSTEYHPAGTCSMLPLEHGGVVNTEMKVYGVTNLRVIDSSIVPIGMSAHMAAPLYGIAERAAAILVSSVAETPTSSAGGSASGTKGTKDTNASATSSSQPSGAVTSAPLKLGSVLLAALLAMVAFL